VPELKERVMVANIDKPNVSLKLKAGEPPLKWAAKLVECYRSI
jgi:hypothetical protein